MRQGEIRRRRTCVSPTGADTVTPSRNQRYTRLCEAVAKVPGEIPEVLQKYLGKFKGSLPPVARELGEGWNESRLCAAFTAVEDPHFEVRPEDVLVCSSKDPDDPSVTLMVVARAKGASTTDAPLGYLIASFARGSEGEGRTGEIVYLMKNLEHRGEAPALGDRLFSTAEKLGAEMGVRRWTLMTDWVGREFWLRQGFDVGPEELATLKHRFQRFLDEFGVNRHELYFDRGAGVRELFSFDKLAHASDFLTIHSTRGEVHVPDFLGNGHLEDRWLPIGRAFVRGPHEDHHADCDFFAQKFDAEKRVVDSFEA